MNYPTVRNPMLICLLILAALFSFNSYARVFLADEQCGGFDVASSSTFTAGAFLGELAPIVADYLVLEAHHFWHEGRWYMMPIMYSMIVNVEPAYIDYWSMLSWLYAFNNSVYVNDPTKKEELINKGIAAARAGLLHHDRRYELYFDAAWIYFKKKNDYGRAEMYLERARQYPHPSKVERLLSIALYRRGRAEEAAAVWEEYLRVHPDDPAAQQELTRIHGLGV
jgi:tetratricopeptide (TPR) repeat protein